MFYQLLILVFLIVVIDCEVNNTDQCPNIKTHLGSIRKRRHLTFPDGSDVVLTISVVKAFMTHAPSGWNLVLEIDVLYPLPDANFTNAHYRRKLHHRQKREFWERVRSALEFHNLNGRACILRSICEAKTYLAEPGRSLVHDILKAIFTAPLHETDFVEEVGDTYNELLDPDFCETDYDCPFSLLHFVLALNKQKY
ncbi:PREDICTED: uncharacterized protein LOC106119493 [Papilio xuthus]|uniref:Uncharacterized protein LOC106119493 n=1 Tax=Papilio xuthus TaxID=66420 RepID=A0AAJ7EB05_PAPXU|nr:PREDICTED: uncharacterized protein LOC106119493 [Papilio xuthus]